MFKEFTLHAESWADEAPPGPMFRPFFYQQRTRRLYVEDLRTIIGNVAKLPGDRVGLAVEAQSVMPWLNPVRLLNGTGRAMIEETLPMLARAVGEKDKLAAETAALEALLALRCHQLETGQLPASLAELVPRYLKSVPLDPYDGQPLRYSRDKRIVYSVGQDLKDSGGATDTEDEKASESRDEPTFEIEF